MTHRASGQRTAIVTGGVGGIGAAAARRLACDGLGICAVHAPGPAGYAIAKAGLFGFAQI